jgi:hypothetical protein
MSGRNACIYTLWIVRRDHRTFSLCKLALSHRQVPAVTTEHLKLVDKRRSHSISLIRNSVEMLFGTPRRTLDIVSVILQVLDGMFRFWWTTFAIPSRCLPDCNSASRGIQKDLPLDTTISQLVYLSPSSGKKRWKNLLWRVHADKAAYTREEE